MPITFEQHCIDYLKTLRALHGSALTTAELSLRTALENFLARTAETFARPVQFIGEGKRIQVGRPDFIVTMNGLPIGYVEAIRQKSRIWMRDFCLISLRRFS